MRLRNSIYSITLPEWRIPKDNLNLEISVASQGEFKATAAVQGASTIEWLRVQSELADLKRGQEKALPMFIAAFINGHHPGPRQAFANAQYGTSNAPELDVVISLARHRIRG